MVAYDEVLGFDYADEEAWRDFATSDILPLYIATRNIIEFTQYLKNKLENSFSDVFLENEGIQKILLGGVTVEGEYAENSLAKFYREHIGVCIDPHLWISLCEEPGTEASQNIALESTGSPEILAKLNTVHKFSGNLLETAGCALPEIDEETINGLIQQPGSIIDEFATVYSQLIQISATYNYHTFFVLSTSITPRFFLLEAYPRLKENFDAISELLGLVVADIPDVDKTMYQGDMVLIKHKSEGFADSLYQLNQITWHMLSSFALFGSPVPPLQEEFIKNIQETNVDQEQLEKLIEGKYYLTDDGRSLLGYIKDSEGDLRRDQDMTLRFFLHTVAPYLFVGLTDLEIRNIPRYSYEADVVGRRTALYIHRDPSTRRYDRDRWDF